MKFKVAVEPAEEGGYIVECPALPGYISEGDTLEEAIENIKEAIQGCMEARNQRINPKDRAMEIVI